MRILLEQAGYTYQEGSVSAAVALRGVDFSVEQGEMLAVIGHGGSGKSTLALLLAGLITPTSGQLTICEEWKHNPELFRSVGLVFQYPEQQLFGESVFEEVAFGARNFGTPEDYLPIKVRQALTDVGLDADAFWHRSPFNLSGGQKRRVCIAGVLATNPRMLIFDEPTAGLDEGGRRWMLRLAQRLNDSGKTVVWITHNMGEAAELAQRVVVLNQGAILLDGPTEQVFDQEETLRQAHLEAPGAARLVRRLRRQGLELPGRAITVDQAFTEINDWLCQQETAAQRQQEQAEAERIAREARLNATGGEADQEAEEQRWEEEARQQLRALVNADGEGIPAGTAAEPEPDSAVGLASGPELDLDLSGLRGDESPRVPEWRGGGSDV